MWLLHPSISSHVKCGKQYLLHCAVEKNKWDPVYIKYLVLFLPQSKCSGTKQKDQRAFMKQSPPWWLHVLFCSDEPASPWPVKLSWSSATTQCFWFPAFCWPPCRHFWTRVPLATALFPWCSAFLLHLFVTIGYAFFCVIEDHPTFLVLFI